MADEETPGVSSAYQIELGIDYTDWEEIVRWQDLGLCHGMTDLFDFRRFSGEIGDSNKASRRELRDEVREKKKRAEPICFECPVFNECWFDAYERLPISVFQAGAALTSAAEEQRRARLEESLVKQQSWFRNKSIRKWREENEHRAAG